MRFNFLGMLRKPIADSPMEVHIRPATSEELPYLIELQTRSIKTLSVHYYSKQEITALVEDQAYARDLGYETRFVAEVQGKIIGFATLWHIECAIGGVYVDPEWVRCGIGSRLLAIVEAEAKQRQIRTLSVMSSLTAVSFYESQGYLFRHPTGFVTRSGIWIQCKTLEKQLLPSESFADRIHRHHVLLAFGIVFLLLGFLFSRPQEPEIRVQPMEDRTP
jgi:putative acetyltransferase